MDKIRPGKVTTFVDMKPVIALLLAQGSYHEARYSSVAGTGKLSWVRQKVMGARFAK